VYVFVASMVGGMVLFAVVNRARPTRADTARTPIAADA
jgi:hypothetical protein